MDESRTEAPAGRLPFNNLYLISGLVHGQNKGWMYMMTVLLVVFGYLGFQLAIFYPLRSLLLQHAYTDSDLIRNPSLLFDYQALGVDRNIVFMCELLMFVFAFLGFLVGVKLIHKKTLTSVITGYERFRMRRFWFAFAVWGGLIVAGVLIDRTLHPGDYELDFRPAGLLGSLALMIVFMPLQTGLEEVLFRGYFVQGLSLLFRNGIVPLILTSLLFALAHMTNPEVVAFGWPIMFTYYAVFALFMGGLTLLDEGIELAFGIHLSNNMLSSVLVTTPHSVIKTYAVFSTGSEDPHREILLWACMAALTFALFWLRYRWKQFRLIIK